jgi:hypothetical protein
MLSVIVLARPAAFVGRGRGSLVASNADARFDISLVVTPRVGFLILRNVPGCISHIVLYRVQSNGDGK